MRRAISFLLVSVFVTAGLPLASAQKTTPATKDKAPSERARTGKQNANRTEFASIRAHTQGGGVWVHWQMEAEYDNHGFYVYKLNGNGKTRISEMELGNAFKHGNEPSYGEKYSFFDESGTTADTYFVEARTARGVIRSSVATVEVGDEDHDGDSPQVPRDEEKIRPTSRELLLPSDLSAEVSANALSANPTSHIDVISQPGAKIKAKASGLIRVTKAQLQTAGFDVNSDSSTWQLYLEGVQLPILIGPSANYIEFLGKELDTVESDVRTYYLIKGATAGKRVIVTPSNPSRDRTVSTSYNQTFSLKERIFHVSNILNGDAENMFGNIISSSGYTLNFNLSGVDLTPGDRTLTLSFQGFSVTSHSIEINLNGNLLAPTVGSAKNRFSKTYSIPAAYLKEGPNQLTMTSLLDNDTSLFDSISLDYARSYKAINNRLEFYTEAKKDTILSGFSTPNVRLFDVTYDGEVLEYVNNTIAQTSGTYGPVIAASRSRVYYATEANNVAAPISVLPNDPALLGVPTNGATLVIIAHSSLMPQAQEWKNYRSTQVPTMLIDVEEIFDEFNYGVSSSNAIKSFLNYAKNNWQMPPGYVLLIGDASYDPKNYQGEYPGEGSWNMVPTRMVNTLFEETGSDEALADFNNDGLAEIPIGRIASRTGIGVTNVLNKTKVWEASITANPSILSRTALFAYDQFDGYDFRAMSDRVMAKLPTAMPKTTVERGKPNATIAQNSVINAFNSGAYVANYTGHGSSAAWRDSSFFDTGDFSALTGSTNTPTLVTALTCLNAYFVPAANNDSFAEAITKVPNGGAVAIWASTGRTTPDVQEVMALRFYEQLSAGNIARLGDLVRDAKAQLIGGRDVRLSWAVIGDPMLKVR